MVRCRSGSRLRARIWKDVQIPVPSLRVLRTSALSGYNCCTPNAHCDGHRVIAAPVCHELCRRTSRGRRRPRKSERGALVRMRVHLSGEGQGSAGSYPRFLRAAFQQFPQISYTHAARAHARARSNSRAHARARTHLRQPAKALRLSSEAGREESKLQVSV